MTDELAALILRTHRFEERPQRECDAANVTGPSYLQIRQAAVPIRFRAPLARGVLPGVARVATIGKSS